MGPAEVAGLGAAWAPHASRSAANVVDIRRFSTHDGEGIRTTIFLKGCSLSCAWCQNPEAIDPRLTPVFFRNRCIDCGRCVDLATHGEARRVPDGTVTVDTTVTGAGWLQLVDACPTGAIAFSGQRYTVDELVETAQRDRVFFGPTGGVTLSGGEPLFMPHFATELLAALQLAGINTAIETALNVRTEFLLQALPHCNHVFADFKLFDPRAHRRWTGSGNAQIRKNLTALLTGERRADVTIRTPLIPGVTDSEYNIHQIAEFISDLYPDVRYELLNYNPMAAAKYPLVPDRSYLFTDDENPPMYSAAQMDAFRDIARAGGVHAIIE